MHPLISTASLDSGKQGSHHHEDVESPTHTEKGFAEEERSPFLRAERWSFFRRNLQARGAVSGSSLGSAAIHRLLDIA